MNTAKEILYLTYDGLSDQLGQSQILPYLLILKERGCNITIVSSEKTGNKHLISKIREKLTTAGIEWHSIQYTKSPIIVSTIFDILRINRLCLKLIRKKKFDIVHCRSYIMALVGYSLKKKFGLKFIFDMRGFFADERIDGGIWNQHILIYRIIYRYFKKQEATFLSKADYTICITEEAKKEIYSWRSIPGQPLPIEVIPCCSDSRKFDYHIISPEQRTMIQQKLGLSNSDFVLSYIGAVGTWYMLDEMLDFFNRLTLVYTNAKFLFITAEDPKIIENKAAEKKISRERLIIMKVLYSEVPLYLSLSQLSIFFIKPLYSKKASSPAKQGEIMNMGIPIICNSNVGDTDRIIESTKAGAIVRTFNEDDYDYLIEKIPELLAIPKEQIRNFALTLFSLEMGAKKYEQVYDKVLTRGDTIHCE